MSIMDRINKSDYVEVFSAVIGKMVATQSRIEEYIDKDGRCNYDFIEGTISFREDVYPVQFIGTQEEVWEWAPEEDYEEFNKSVFSMINESNALGKEWNLEVLTLPKLEISDDRNGDHLSALCCGISKGNYVSYIVNQDDLFIFLGIGNAPEEVYAPVERNEFKKIVTKCIEDFTIDHKIFLEAFLEWNKTPYEWDGDKVIAHFDKDVIFVFEEDEGDYCITTIKTVSDKKSSKKKANSKISITVEDGGIKISGKMNLGYIGTYTDDEIEINDTLEEIREWDIVQDNLDEDCSDEELIAFLNRYFNEFADKITRNIDNINGTFLLQTLTDMDCNEIDFMVIDELFLEDKLPYGNEEDIAELYNFARDGMRSLIPYLESPNDGCIPKGHLERILRGFYPAFDFDCFIANIVPEVVTLCDGSIAFQCSDAFDEAILCGAYAELDEELSFTDWHNF